MRASRLNQRTRDFVLIMAQLAAIACFFQVLAVDHWFSDPSHVVPETRQVHAQHCHGDLSGCSDGIGSAPDTALSRTLLPSPVLPAFAAAPEAALAPVEAFIAPPYRPPAAA